MKNAPAIKLSDKEWMSLLDGDAKDSALPTCCANVSALRDTLAQIVRQGRDKPLMLFDLDDLKQRLKWVHDGHKLSPTLKKICAQIGFDPTKAEHRNQSVEAYNQGDFSCRKKES